MRTIREILQKLASTSVVPPIREKNPAALKTPQATVVKPTDPMNPPKLGSMDMDNEKIHAISESSRKMVADMSKAHRRGQMAGGALSGLGGALTSGAMAASNPQAAQASASAKSDMPRAMNVFNDISNFSQQAMAGHAEKKQQLQSIGRQSEMMQKVLNPGQQVVKPKAGIANRIMSGLGSVAMSPFKKLLGR